MGALDKYTKKRFNRLTHLLESASDSDDIEILHKIRLEIKKIKALLGLIHFKFPTVNTHKIFIPVRAIFRKAGEIREPYIIESLLIRHGIANSSYNSIFPSKKTIKSFRIKIPKFSRQVKKTERKIKKKISKVTVKDLSKYLKKQEKELSKKLFPKLDLSSLHKSRKFIKEILYLSSINGKNRLYPFFSDSAELIGEWNDKQVIMQWLKKNGLPHAAATQKLKQECEGDLLLLNKAVTDYYTLK